jgi:hypothetical protein
MASRLFCGRISPSMRTTDFRLLGCDIGEIHPGFTGRSLLSMATVCMTPGPENAAPGRWSS